MKKTTKFEIEPTELWKGKLPDNFLEAKKNKKYVRISPRFEDDGTLSISAMVFAKQPKLTPEEKERRRKAREEAREKRLAKKKAEKEEKLKKRLAEIQAKLNTLKML